MAIAGDDTVRRVLDALRATGTNSAAETAELLARAEPVARQACRSHIRRIRDEILDELVQHTLVIACTKMEGTWAADGPAWDRWVRGIARNVCRNDRRVHRDLLTEDGVFEITDANGGVLSALLVDERDHIVRLAIEKLPGDEQEAVYHRYIHDLSRSEIAALLELPDAEAVRALLQRAQRHLKLLIVEQLEAAGYSNPFGGGTRS